MIIEFPIDDTCCHTGGSIRFGPDGALYIGVGDNSNPHRLGGYAPLSRDEVVRDARRSAGDTMDLRGKILRILPSPSGNYEVPEGNLFGDADEGRPEIYVMGARNPYTIGFDWDTGDLYYGDVGPDAHLDDPARGSKGFDEVNRVTRAGNFGWPFFIGDNYPYRIIDEETGEPGKLQDPLRPINNSARNQGAEILPPAEPALIWYPYSRSKKFHELGQGGRNALTAGVYRRADHPAGAPAWPAYFDGKVIVSDFMRRHFIAITLDEAGRRVKLESLAENADFPPPIDLEFGPEGALYVLQYGTRWWQGNEDAGLSRIVFNGDGNRAPVVSFSLDAPAGAAPLALSADSEATFDPDGDPLELSWAQISLAPGQVVADGKALFDQAQASESSSFVFREPGLHAVLMRAIDDRGAESFGHAFVNVGNEPPSVTIKVSGNRSLLWPENGSIAYSVEIEDAEDGSTADGTIAGGAADVQLSVREITYVEDLQGFLAEGQAGARALGLMEQHACLVCHQTTASSLGPAYREVAQRYASQDDAREALANSITNGSEGQWGDAAMPAYDFLSSEEIQALTGYILDLGREAELLPGQGEIDPGRLLASDSEVIEITARYVDRGFQGAAPLEATDQVRLRGATIPLASLLPRDGGQQEGVRIGTVDRTLHAIFQGEGTALPLGEYDLTHIGALRLLITDSDTAPPGRLQLQLRARHVGGEVLGSVEVTLSAPSVSQEREAVLQFSRTIDDFRELFLVVNPVSAADAKALISIKTATFVQRGSS